MSKCCENENECEQESCATESCKPCCDTAAESCPIECAADMWKKSFFVAMQQAQVEILKAKILKAHGPMMEEAADALLASMMACWQSQLAKVHAAEAAHEFKEKLHELWSKK